MNTTETITWHPASEPPDNDRTVLVKYENRLVAAQGGYNYGEWLAIGAHYCHGQATHWAELPRGPGHE